MFLQFFIKALYANQAACFMPYMSFLIFNKHNHSMQFFFYMVFLTNIISKILGIYTHTFWSRRIFLEEEIFDIESKKNAPLEASEMVLFNNNLVSRSNAASNDASSEYSNLSAPTVI